MPVKDREKRRLPRLGTIRLGYLAEGTRDDGSTYKYPKQADHFLLHDAPKIAAFFEAQGITKPRELDVILPFPGLAGNYDASYMVWAKGVLMCKGDGERVQYANPMRVVQDERGTHVYNVAGPTLVVDGVAQTGFTWGDHEFGEGEIVRCLGSAGAKHGHPHCKACKMSAILKVTPYADELFQFGYYQINTGSWRNHQTIMGTLEALPPIVFEKKLPFTLRMVWEQTVYKDSAGKRHATERWFLHLMPHPDLLRALFERQARELAEGPAPKVRPLPGGGGYIEAEPVTMPPYAEAGVEMGVEEAQWEEPPPPEPPPQEPPSQEPPSQEPPPQEPPKRPAPGGRPYDPETLKRRILLVAARKRKAGRASMAQVGLVLALCGQMWQEPKQHVPRLLEYLFKVSEPGELSYKQVSALIDWLRDPESERGQNTIDQRAVAEARQVVVEMLKREGQQMLPGLEE